MSGHSKNVRDERSAGGANPAVARVTYPRLSAYLENYTLKERTDIKSIKARKVSLQKAESMRRNKKARMQRKRTGSLSSNAILQRQVTKVTGPGKKVKQRRAQGGCLGTKSRRKT